MTDLLGLHTHYAHTLTGTHTHTHWAQKDTAARHTPASVYVCENICGLTFSTGDAQFNAVSVIVVIIACYFCYWYLLLMLPLIILEVARQKVTGCTTTLSGF